MSTRKKYQPFARAPHAVQPHVYMAPTLIAIFILANALVVYRAPLVGGYMHVVEAVGQVQGDSYRTTASAALSLWSSSTEWFVELGQKADYLKSVYINMEK